VRRLVSVFAAFSLVASLGGCARASGPLTVSREVLGTAVSVTVYSDDPSRATPAVDAAFASMTAVERTLSPYDASSTVAAFNHAPLAPHALPSDALAILDRTRELGVTGSFNPALFGVTVLYGFGGAGTVPDAGALRSAVGAVATFRVAADGTASFGASQTAGAPGLDFGGASKGLALDRAAQALRGSPALITAGSSTLAFGSKPDGQPWRVGIEDPRAVGRVLAVVSSESTLSVSTSGDYHVYFERGGVRYHHILDPATGSPARGLRSLTVFGSMSALDADILSTALFVMGGDKALAYAREHAIGVYLVDDHGAARSSVPASSSVTLTTEAQPTP
jgi:thiamine biosynthesis lipoprotein